MAIGENPQAVTATPGGFILSGAARKGPQLGGRRVLRDRQRSGGQSEPRLVPRRLVGSADDGVERRRRRAPAIDRPPIDRRRRHRPGRRCSCRSRSPRGVQDHRAAARLVSSGQTNLRIGKDPEAGPGVESVPGTYQAVVCGPVRRHRRSQRATGAITTTSCAPERQRFSDCFYDSTLPPEVDRGGGREPHDPEVADGAAPGRRPAVGVGRLQRQLRAAATAPARTSGTTRRPSRTSSRRWNARCARRSSARRRTSAATSSSAARCRSGPSRTTSTPRPTASSAAS